MNTMQDQLQDAIDKKGVNLNSFVWKGHKVLDADGKYKQSEQKLVTMNEQELRACYEHCKTMLFNKDMQNPGRYLVLDTIADQLDRCGAELVLRHIEEEHELGRFSLMEMISAFLTANKEVLKKELKPTLDLAFGSLPDEYQKLSIHLVMDGCLDRLGIFNKKHITRTFILKQGIWLTPAESKDLVEYDGVGNTIDRLLVIRERLNIKDIEKLYLNAKGLNYTQMRAMLNIKPNKKYRDLTTLQLQTLRNRILFNLEETVKEHITAWERRMEEIEMVLASKGITA